MRKITPPTRDDLFRMYVTERKTIDVISANLGCGHATVSRWLAQYGIETRPMTEAHPDTKRSDITPELLRHLYVEEDRTATDVASCLGCSVSTVFNYLAKFGIPRHTHYESHKNATYGSHCTLYKHGKYAMRFHYRTLIERDRCAKCGATRETTTIVAHHINGIHTDDRPENIEALCKACHESLHHKGLPRVRGHHGRYIPIAHRKPRV